MGLAANLLVGALGVALAGCGDRAQIEVSAGSGADPAPPTPHATLLPTVHIAASRGWALAETPHEAPPQPDEHRGSEGWSMGLAMVRAGAATPSANRIVLLRDNRGEGIADQRTVLIEGLHSPFGMVLVGDGLHVADCDAVLRIPYVTGDLRITAAGVKLPFVPFSEGIPSGATPSEVLAGFLDAQGHAALDAIKTRRTEPEGGK